jgi:hypothetical protein
LQTDTLSRFSGFHFIKERKITLEYSEEANENNEGDSIPGNDLQENLSSGVARGFVFCKTLLKNIYV